MNLLREIKEQTAPRAPRSSVMMVSCKICGQPYNLFNLSEAYHHGPEPHEPLPLSKR